MGGCEVDEVKENEWAGIFRGWQTQFWRANVYISIGVYCAWDIERNNFNF